MLVLSRHIGEKIYIGNNIVVTLLGTSIGKAKIGISAEEAQLVGRKEIGVGEEVRIGSDIVVMLVAIDKWQAKIGISADKAIPVHRKEIFCQRHPGEDFPADEDFYDVTIFRLNKNHCAVM